MFCTIVFHSVARNDVPQHSVALCIILQHGVSCHGVVCCAVAMFGVLLLRGWEITINLCSIGGHHSGIVAAILALLVVVFFVEAVALLSFA